MTNPVRQSTPSPAPRPAAVIPIRDPLLNQPLDALSAQVVQLALREPKAALRTDGRLRRVVNRVFGLPSRSRLADDRLELLRQFCLCYRFRDSRQAALREDLKSTHLYSDFQLRTICGLIDQG